VLSWHSSFSIRLVVVCVHCMVWCMVCWVRCLRTVYVLVRLLSLSTVNACLCVVSAVFVNCQLSMHVCAFCRVCVCVCALCCVWGRGVRTNLARARASETVRCDNP